MKNSKINSERLIASSIAAAILAITGSTPVTGTSTVALNRVNDGELMIACANFPFCCPPLCWRNNDNQGNPEQEEIVDREKGRSVAIADSKKAFLI